MKRYIDADALLDRLPDDLPYKASVKRVLMQAPAADVAPMKEVERLRHILDSYALQYGSVKDQHELIERIRSDVKNECVEALAPLIDTLCRVTGIEISYFGEFANQSKQEDKP